MGGRKHQCVLLNMLKISVLEKTQQKLVALGKGTGKLGHVDRRTNVSLCSLQFEF